MLFYREIGPEVTFCTIYYRTVNSKRSALRVILNADYQADLPGDTGKAAAAAEGNAGGGQDCAEEVAARLGKVEQGLGHVPYGLDGPDALRLGYDVLELASG